MIRTVFTIAALCILLALPAPRLHAANQDAGAKPASPPEAALDTSPVEIDDHLLFRVRGASSFPAEERAAAIKKRIETAAANQAIKSDSLTMEEDENGTVIMAGGQPLMLVTDHDAALEHMNRQNLAKLHMSRIRQAIDEYRLNRTGDTLLRGTLYAVAATAVLVISIALLIPLVRRLDRVLSKRVHNVNIQSFEVLRTDHIWKTLHGMLYGMETLAIIVLVLAYVHVVLHLFPWTRGLGRWLLGMDTDLLTRMGKAVVAWIPDLLILIVLYFLFRFLLRLMRQFFEAVGRQTVVISGFDAEWARPTYKMARFVLLAFAVVVAYPYLPGSESAAFKGVSVFIGLVFSLGSSAAVSNIIAGYLITYRRVFKVGDRVKVGEVVGNVKSVRLQVTHIVSLKNEEITIPNSQILNGNVVNFTALAPKQGLILHTEVGIGYETPWRQVEAMLLEAAGRTEGVLGDPPPFILIRRLGDFAVVYELNLYCGTPQQMERKYSELHRHILDVFNEYNVQIMTPAYIADTPQPKVVPREQWYAPPASPDYQSPVPRDDYGVVSPDTVDRSK